MPYCFRFQPPVPQAAFRCTLQCSQCTALTARGTQCARRTCIGVSLCWSHLIRDRKLRILPSTLPGAGKGLFAHAPDQEIVFRRGDRIVDYGGEVLTVAQLAERYGQWTGPYAFGATRTIIQDAACVRSVGSIVNHRAAPNARYGVYQGRGFIKALRNIRHGEEIFVNYGRAYNMNEPTQHTTKRCRG